MQDSLYNYQFTSLDGEPLLCNGLSGTIFTKPSRPLLSFTGAEREFLIYHHFIVESAEAEQNLLSNRNRTARETTNNHDLTIMLHEECNFRCTYCFEQFRPTAIKKENIDAIEYHLKKVLVKGDNLRVHFYGGEPLLAWKQLVYCTQSFNTLTSKLGAHFLFYLTTNGYLLDDRKVDFLVEQGASHIKITLDGDRASHDRRRVRKTGQPTFEKVYYNAARASERLPVIIRINLDRDTAQSCPSLLNSISQRFRHDYTTIDFNLQYEQKTKRLVGGVTYDEMANLQELALKLGLKLRVPPLVRPTFCKFQNKNALLIDTQAQTFRCEKSPELVEEPLHRGEPLRHQHLHEPSTSSRFLSTLKKCDSCRLLPICGGGCTVLSIGQEIPSCPPWKNNFERYLAINYANSYAGDV